MNAWSCSQHKNNHFHLTTTIMNHHWQQNTLQNTCNTEICDPSGSNWTNSPHGLLSSIMQKENRSWYTHWQWHDTHIVQTTKQLTLVSLNKDVLTGQKPRSVCGPDTALTVIPFFFQYGASPVELHPTLYRYRVVAFFCITVNFPRLFVLTEQQPIHYRPHNMFVCELWQPNFNKRLWHVIVEQPITRRDHGAALREINTIISFLNVNKFCCIHFQTNDWFKKKM